MTEENEETTEKFYNYFRMTPSQFDELVTLLKPHIEKNIRSSISSEEKIAATLRYLASGDSMISIGYSFRLSKTTMSFIIRDVTGAIWKALYNKVFPSKYTYTQDFWLQVAEGIEEKSNFPNCLGALDEKHVVVQAFPNSGSAYFNYKNSHSLVLMAMCDANCKFTMVDIGAAGRFSDGGIFKCTTFFKKLTDNKNSLNIPRPRILPNSQKLNNFCILGDEAFPLLPNLMRPYPGRKNSRLPVGEAVYNYRLSRARRLIENAFGILSAKWRIYRKPIIASKETAINIIKATVCLHNFLIDASSSLYIDNVSQDGVLIPEIWRAITQNDTGLQAINRNANNRCSCAAQDVRDIFRNYFINDYLYFINDSFIVPWQLGYTFNVQ